MAWETTQNKTKQQQQKKSYQLKGNDWGCIISTGYQFQKIKYGLFCHCICEEITQYLFSFCRALSFCSYFQIFGHKFKFSYHRIHCLKQIFHFTFLFITIKFEFLFQFLLESISINFWNTKNLPTYLSETFLPISQNASFDFLLLFLGVQNQKQPW